MNPGARPQVEQQLRCALKTPHEEEDITYIPCINEQYPRPLRRHAASLFCTAGFPLCEEHPTQDVSIDIPHGILDDAPLAVILGGVAWFAACLFPSNFDFEGSDDVHHEEWHVIFLEIWGKVVETVTEYPFPKLPTQGFAFCIELFFDYPEPFGGNKQHILRIFAAMAIFLRNKNVLLGCRRCQILCTRFFSDTTRSTSINESSVNTDASGIPS